MKAVNVINNIYRNNKRNNMNWTSNKAIIYYLIGITLLIVSASDYATSVISVFLFETLNLDMFLFMLIINFVLIFFFLKKCFKIREILKKCRKEEIFVHLAIIIIYIISKSR